MQNPPSRIIQIAKPITIKWAIRTFIALLLVAVSPFVIHYMRWALDFGTDNKPKNSVSERESLGITEVVRQVKTELAAAELQRLKANEEALFILEDFDLEINFVLRRSSSQASGMAPQFMVVSENSEYSSEEIQKIFLHMTATPGRKAEGKTTVGQLPPGIE